MFKKTTNKRIYEMECYKGYFRIEVEDIEEIVCNSKTGETSRLMCEVHYRDTKDSGLTTFLIGSYVTTTEQKEVEYYYDLIINTDYFDGMIEGHKKDLEILEEHFLNELNKK